MIIKIENDHKEKRQSWTATIDEVSSGDGTGHYNCYFQGYASTEYQAKINVIKHTYFIHNFPQCFKSIGPLVNMLLAFKALETIPVLCQQKGCVGSEMAIFANVQYCICTADG